MTFAEDFLAANEEWDANCGPGALAAVLGCTMSEVRRFFPDFGDKPWTNPTTMLAALRMSGRRHLSRSSTAFPVHGLCRVQWEGPWMRPTVPIAARYQKTHWIAAHNIASQVAIFDVNALDEFCPDGWLSLENWGAKIAPALMAEIKRCTGWSITHSIEVARRIG